MVQQPGVGHDAGDGGDMLSRLSACSNPSPRTLLLTHVGLQVRLHSQGEISAEELKDHV
jgi:hypothetical protein